VSTLKRSIDVVEIHGQQHSAPVTKSRKQQISRLEQMHGSAIKLCTKCREEKPIADFSQQRSNKDGYRNHCRLCIADYRAAHREESATRYAAYRAAHRDEIAAYRAAWRAAHRAEQAAYSAAYSADHREAQKAYKAAYYAAYPEKRAVGGRNRRARKRAAPGKHTAADIKRLLLLQKSKCSCCRKSITKGYHVDHIVPLARGGSNDPYNLQLLCPTCNLKKRAKDPVEFMQSRGMLL
jgi:5-methylcytosine-specific restriction endonuclease McrA